MKPEWLIQINMEDVDTNPIIDEVRAQGMSVTPITHLLDRQVDFNGYDSSDCVICYGNIDFIKQVRRMAPFIPGAWCDFRNMKCSTYYAHLGEYLLNQQYMMMPVGDLLRRWHELTTYTHIPDQPWFIRPDSGDKPFTGFVVTPNEKHRIESLVQSVGLETLVVIAPEKKITTEWRFVICDKQVVTGCQYLPDEKPIWHPLSFRLAERIASQKWQPDLCYTVDIAESESNTYLLEINSFSCSGFYDCDIEQIVKHASQAAIKEWREYL